LSTGADLLTDKQRQRISALFAEDGHLEVEATWGVYQAMVGAYRDPDRASGKTKMQTLIDTLAVGVPAALREVRTLGRTLSQRATDVLAYFDRPGTSNGPTEAINGRLEHLRGSALGFAEPDQLCRQVVAGGRRVPTRPTPSIAMSPQICI
jgi:transposase